MNSPKARKIKMKTSYGQQLLQAFETCTNNIASANNVEDLGSFSKKEIPQNESFWLCRILKIPVMCWKADCS